LRDTPNTKLKSVCTIVFVPVDLPAGIFLFAGNAPAFALAEVPVIVFGFANIAMNMPLFHFKAMCLFSAQFTMPYTVRYAAVLVVCTLSNLRLHGCKA